MIEMARDQTGRGSAQIRHLENLFLFLSRARRVK
jgi:hypothetical protein